jgi:hypothetical protein
MAAVSASFSGSVYQARRSFRMRGAWRSSAPRRSWPATWRPQPKVASRENDSLRRNSSVKADSETEGINALTCGGS